MRFRFSFQKLALIGSLLIPAVLFVVTQTFAQECVENACPEDDQGCWARAVDACETKVNETRQQANTLKEAIADLNGQIISKQVKVNRTRAEIYQLETEINDLSQRIEGLGYSLDRLNTVLNERVRTQYKESRTAPALQLLGAETLSGFVTQMKYLVLAQRQTADTMERTYNQRLEYDEQKQLKEETQAQLDAKRQQLEREKTAVTQKRTEQQNLLNITNNSEQKYQSLLAQANSQLASFSRFASNIGVSLLSNQTSCNGWGCYYSQRDSQWGNMYLGNSNYTVAQAGCLVTSVAMMATHYGKSLTPAQIASNSSLFQGAGLEYQLDVNGVKITRSSICSNSSCLDSALEGGPVVVRITAANFAGTHFLVILEKKDDQYIMHDPAIANGHDLKFTDHYSLGIITRVDRISVQ